MELARELSIVLFSAILVDNFVLTRFMGICPFLGVSKKVGPAFGMSCAVIFVMVAATAVTYPIYTYLLEPNGLAYLDTLTFILVIAAFVQLVELVLGRFLPSLHRTLGIYLPLITTNCAVLGVTLLNIEDNYNFGQSIVQALGAGVGFLLAMVLFAGVRSKMEDAEIPEFMKGLPSTLVAASIVSMSFMGFAGVAEGIFK